MTQVLRAAQPPATNGKQPVASQQPSRRETHGATSQKLSDVILLGARMRPQTFRVFFGTSGGSCVIGAAIEGTFGKYQGHDFRALYLALQQAYPELNIPIYIPCPVCGLSEEWRIQTPPVSTWMIHLNDDHRISRERIAQELRKVGL